MLLVSIPVGFVKRTIFEALRLKGCSKEIGVGVGDVRVEKGV
jgi:hypothetical protein